MLYILITLAAIADNFAFITIFAIKGWLEHTVYGSSAAVFNGTLIKSPNESLSIDFYSKERF